MNLQTGQTGKEIELAWLKTTTAFMNSEGEFYFLASMMMVNLSVLRLISLKTRTSAGCILKILSINILELNLRAI